MLAIYTLANPGWLRQLTLGGWYVMQAYVGMFYAYVFIPVILYLLCAVCTGRL